MATYKTVFVGYDKDHNTIQHVYKDSKFIGEYGWCDAQGVIRGLFSNGDIYQEEEKGIVYCSLSYEQAIEMWETEDNFGNG